jgi:hypothetical protein
MKQYVAFINNKRYETILFWTVCFVLSVLQYFYGLQHFYYDAERYWESGREMKVDGVFSLVNHVTQRGVLFPLFNYGLIELLGYIDWHEISVFKCISTVFCMWGFWYLLPDVFRKVTGQSLTNLHKLVLITIANIFWFRYFSCPLSDFLCFFLLLWGFLLLWSEKASWIKVIVAGIVCGIVFNTRPIYVLLLGIYPIFYLISSRASWTIKGLHIALLLVFAMAVNLPQYYVNKKVWGVETFFQPTEKYYQGRNLYLMQLKWGLYVQKYETYVGDTSCYASVPVFYYHDKNTALTVEQPAAQQIETYEQYFAYLKQHPVCVLWYAKNVFNGLDIQYNTPYIYDLKPQLWFAFMNYLIWATGFILIVLCWKVWAQSKAFVFLVASILLTSALAVPTATEVRFLLGLYCLIYLVVVSQFHELVVFWKNSSVRSRFMITGFYVLFVLVCVYLSQTTFQQLLFEIKC